MQDHNIYEDLQGRGEERERGSSRKEGRERKGVHGLTQHQAVKIHTKLS